jgi:hypothetical protein
MILEQINKIPFLIITLSRGENAVTVSGYWAKPLTATAWAVTKNDQPPPPIA